jgi:hypothetical protein
MKVSDTLQAAKQKILNIKDWFPGFDRSNIEIQSRFINRECNCALTAISVSDNYNECRSFLIKAIKIVDPDAAEEDLVVYWNDSTSHEMVLKAYDAAIDLAKKSEAV